MKNKPSDKEIDAALDEIENAKRSDVKLSITFRLDADIYDELNRRAELGEGKGRYQTLMNEILRKAVIEGVVKKSTEERLEAIERALVSIKTG